MTTSATSSTTSNIVATLGAGSGIDFSALATNLAAAQFAGRVDRNTDRAELVERQISAASTLKSQLLQLAGSVGDRVRNGDLSAQPQIANAAVAAVSRGTLPGSGTYSLEVTALAAAQVLAAPAYPASTSVVGGGTLTLRFGSIAGGAFTEDPAHAAANITIAAGATLADVAAAINSANSGVTAYVAAGADGARLMLKGAEGAANAFVIEATEDPGSPGLAALAWDPGAATDLRLKTAADAAFKLDGLAMTSASNTVRDVAPGLTLALTGTNVGAPTTIRFSDPSAGVSAFMQDFTAALNELMAGLNTEANPLGGDLARDPGARALRQELSRLANTALIPNAPEGAPATLSDLGLATNRDGTFRLDTTRLAATIRSDPAGVAALFTTGINGVYGTLDRLSRDQTAVANPGSLGGSVARYTALKTKLATEKSTLTEDQEKLRIQLVSRFAGTENRISASRSTLTFLQNQIAAWNAQKD